MLKFSKKFVGALTFISLVAAPLQMVNALTIDTSGSGYDPASTDTGNTSAKVPMSTNYNGAPGTTGGSTGSTDTGNTSNKVPTGDSTGSNPNTSNKVPIDGDYKGPPADSGTGTGDTGNGNTSNKVPIDGDYKGPPAGEVSACNGHVYPKDIDGHWAEIYIRRLYDLCIIEGYSDGNFRPDQQVTRAELTKMALAGKGIDPNPGCYDNDCGSPFVDLDSWQGKWIRPAWDRNIVQGYSKTIFKPNKSITRAEAVKVVLATYGYNPVNTSTSFFNDVNGWSVGWIERAHEIGLVQGIGNGNFDPNRPITRAEAAKVIAKMVEYWDTKIQ